MSQNFYDLSQGEAGETEDVEVDLTQSMSDEETGPDYVEQVDTKTTFKTFFKKTLLRR